MSKHLYGARGRTVGVILLLACLFPGLAHASPFSLTGNPLTAIHVHDFDEEHAHLAEENGFDRLHPLILAALPKGKAYIKYNAPSKCVPARLKSVLAAVSKRYGPITVNSTFRSKSRNRRAGGKSKSYHLSCNAVDFRVHGRTRGLIGFLSKQKGVGGLKRYKSGFYHIDTGPRRNW